MTNKSRLAAGALALSLAAASVALAAAPGMSTSWKSMTLDQSECLRQAERAVRGAGFTKNFELVGQSVYGERGDYTAGVRCVSEKEIVIFMVSGPVGNEASRYQKIISERFEH